jgi:hypothetical protein
MELSDLVSDVADELVAIDSSGIAFKSFKPGVGPYGEPQLIREIARRLNEKANYAGKVLTKRTPDLLIKGNWAMEFKIARPFGDNTKQAENWSVNLLHPYEGNASLIGDCLKLKRLELQERKAVAVIGYEHSPPQIELEPLIRSFELLTKEIVGVNLGPRIHATRTGLAHPVHQQLSLFAWEVL